MIYLLHRACKKGLRISPGDEGELEGMFPPDALYSCPWCGKLDAEVHEFAEPKVLRDIEFFDVTPKEAFAATAGLGLPDEQDCSATAVEKLLKEQRVASVGVKMIRNSHRSIIDYIEFEDGTKMYLGSSSLGATVYRIAPKHRYSDMEEKRG